MYADDYGIESEWEKVDFMDLCVSEIYIER